jgi:hypothetical protein
MHLIVRVRGYVRMHLGAYTRSIEDLKSGNRSPNTSRPNVWTNIHPVGGSAVYRSATIDQIKDPRSIRTDTAIPSRGTNDQGRESSDYAAFVTRFYAVWAASREILIDQVRRGEARHGCDISTESLRKTTTRDRNCIGVAATNGGDYQGFIRGRCIKNERRVVAFSLNARNRSASNSRPSRYREDQRARVGSNDCNSRIECAGYSMD